MTPAARRSGPIKVRLRLPVGTKSPVAWAATVTLLTAHLGPSIVLAAGSDHGDEVMAHIGAKIDLPLAANCTEVVPGEPFRLTRQRWAGSLLEDATLDSPTKLLTIAPHAVAVEGAVEGAAQPAIEPFSPILTAEDLLVAVVRRLAPDRSGISLTDARVVVGGGRGVGSAEAFSELEELAAVL